MKPPRLTLSIFLSLLGLFFAVSDHEVLYFNADLIAQGEYWRLLSGHFIHSDSQHLIWNAAALLILGTIVETISIRMFLYSVLMGILIISLTLMSPWSQLEWYCGFSGVLNSLLVAALWLEWQNKQTLWIPLIGVVAGAKIIGEIVTQQSFFTQMSWQAYPLAHLWGFVAGVILILGLNIQRLKRKNGGMTSGIH